MAIVSDRGAADGVLLIDVPEWLPSAMGLLFVGLRLIGEIDWSWWWVLSPWWIVIAIRAALATVMAIRARRLE